MMAELRKVTYDEKEILRNLMEKYNYEFSQYDLDDVNQLGLYGYKNFDPYWTDENRHPFFIVVDGKLAGFVLVNTHHTADGELAEHSIAEFFVMYKYRRMGIGRFAAFSAFDMFPGRWQLKRHPKNITSVHFWDRVVDEYMHGKYRLIQNYEGYSYNDGSRSDMYLFDNTKK
jgi:predicted acetyltransferase